jgi:glycine dehydrogenase subunit 1
MLDFIGAKNAEELLVEMIPERLLFKHRMELPESYLNELDLKRHVSGILSKNKNSEERERIAYERILK